MFTGKESGKECIYAIYKCNIYYCNVCVIHIIKYMCVIYMLYICKTDSLCCTLETNTMVVNQLQFNEKKKTTPILCLLKFYALGQTRFPASCMILEEEWSFWCLWGQGMERYPCLFSATGSSYRLRRRQP